MSSETQDQKCGRLWLIPKTQQVHEFLNRAPHKWMIALGVPICKTHDCRTVKKPTTMICYGESEEYVQACLERN